MTLEEHKDYFSEEYQTNRLAVAVCNAGINSGELSDMPYERWEDLALFYGVRVPSEKNRAGIAAIHKESVPWSTAWLKWNSATKLILI